jgi:N-acetylmuramoyl-L-alanine amidase
MEFIPSPNFRVSKNRKITAIVIHYTASMSIEGCIAWFKDRKAGVSAHYVIGRDGRLVQMVKDEHVAWHAGASQMPLHAGGEASVNNFSIGIELVGTMDSGFTDKQMAALYTLLEQLVKKYRVKPERVVGHKDIAPKRKIDPDGVGNQFNWTRTREVVTAAFKGSSHV